MPRPRARRGGKRTGSGRPIGSAVPIERNRQKFAIVIWRVARYHRLLRLGPYEAAYLAAVVVSDQPIKLADVEGVLGLASTTVPYTASNLDKHIDRLARTAKAAPADNPWLRQSAEAVGALVSAMQVDATETICELLDDLIALGWSDLLTRLTARLEEALRGNVPPADGPLARAARRLLSRAKSEREEK
jgi:hypothetical protein